jgi:ribonuclease D
MIRKRILTDETIIQLALTPPENISSLNQLIDRRHNISDRDKQLLFDAINSASQCPADQCPDNRFNALDGQQKILLKKLQQLVNEKAEELGISNAILCSRKDLEDLILAPAEATQAELPRLYNSQSWRYQCIGQHLINAVKNSK